MDVDVEQVGGGAAGYMLRRLHADASQDAVDTLDEAAGTPGQAVYAAIDGPTVLGLALLRLGERSVAVLGTVEDRDDVRTALVERAQHDAAAAGLAGVLSIES
jgi:hypothetical protein